MSLQNKTFPLFSLVFLLFLLFIPNLFLVFYLKQFGITVYLNNLLLILCVILCFKVNRVKIISGFLLVCYVINNGLAIFSLHYYKELFNATMALNFLSTNSREAKEMLWEFKYVLLLGLVYFVILYLLISKIISKKLDSKILLGGITLLLLLPAYKSYSVFHQNKVNYDKIGGTVSSRYISTTPFYNLAPFLEANSYLESTRLFKDNIFVYPSFEVNSVDDLDNIIVVLGESARKDALHLYGNKELTSPFLEKRLNNLLVYDNAIAPSSFTNTAVTLLLSKQLPSNNFTVEQNADNLIALGNSSKFWNTYWLSSQENAGIYVNLFSTINSLAQVKEWTKDSKYDEDVIPLFSDAVRDNNKKRLIFVHINGSHPIVSQRYPKEYNKFTNDKRQFVNEYNNSILYTDYVLNEIIKKVENTKSIVIYVSDHGQSIVEGGYKHSFTKKGVDVPFFIWHSDSVDESLKKVGRVKEPISTTNLYNIVCEYMGIKGLEPKGPNKELKLLTPSIDMTYYKDLPDGE